MELIEEDLGCNLEDTYQHMIKSGLFSSLLFTDTDKDKELDSICHNIIVEQRKSNQAANNHLKVLGEMHQVCDFKSSFLPCCNSQYPKIVCREATPPSTTLQSHHASRC